METEEIMEAGGELSVLFELGVLNWAESVLRKHFKLAQNYLRLTSENSITSIIHHHSGWFHTTGESLCFCHLLSI